MSKPKSLTILQSIVLAFSLGLSLAAQSSLATPLTARPLPHERDLKDFSDGQSVIIPSSATRFNRRPDYREEERLKKEADAAEAKKQELARLQSIEAAKKAQQQQVENYQKYLQMAVDANNRAVQLGKANRWMEAIAEHEKAVQYDPRNKQFRINLSAARTAYGQQRMAAHDYGTASHMFRKAVSAASDNAMAAKSLVEALKKQGIDPGNADQRIELGDKLATANDFEGATIEYQAAMQLENSARTLVKMGDMSLRYGQIQAAMNWYRQAIVKDPDYGPAHRQLGFVQMSRGDLTLAATSLRKAVICDSKDTAAGESLIEIWRKQVAQNPLLAENHLGLAGALQLTGDFVGADTEYRKLEALDPKNPGLESGRASLQRAYQHAKADKHKLAAETLFRQGLKREALAEVSQAVMIEPKNAKYQLLLGKCLEACGDYRSAHQAYLTCVLIDPENNEEAAERMRDMQSATKMPDSAVRQMGGQIANQITGAMNRPMQQQMPQQMQMHQPMQHPGMQQHMSPQMPHPAMQQQMQQQMPQQRSAFRVAPPMEPQQEQASHPRKNMFEGVNGAQQNFNSPALDFRTHDESPSAAGQPQEMPPAQPMQVARNVVQPPQQKPATTGGDLSVNDALAKASYLESQKDHAGAATVLKELLTNNLQNADLHHRLAVNLLAAGEISEAVSEFRIASALVPSKKIFSDDLARALAIHKRSLMSDKSEAGADR